MREFSHALPIRRPADSRHLRLLKGVRLVVDRPEGTRRIYQVYSAGLDAGRAYLEQVRGAGTARRDADTPDRLSERSR